LATKLKDMIGSWAASPPVLYYQLKQAMDDPDTTFDDYSRIISADPALTARLLKIVNSPFYGFSSTIETIDHALEIIGTDQLMDLALATVVVSKFKGIPRELIHMESFWMHSIATGIAARKMAQAVNVENPERFYLAGMLHDIGTLLTLKQQTDVAKGVLERCRDTKEHLYIVEKETYGFNHAEVCQLLLMEWQLPQRLVDMVTYHHNPLEVNDPELLRDCCILNMSDIMIYFLKIGNSGEPAVPQLLPEVPEKAGVPKDVIDRIRKQVPNEVDDTVKMFI